MCWTKNTNSTKKPKALVFRSNSGKDSVSAPSTLSVLPVEKEVLGKRLLMDLCQICGFSGWTQKLLEVDAEYVFSSPQHAGALSCPDRDASSSSHCRRDKTNPWSWQGWHLSVNCFRQQMLKDTKLSTILKQKAHPQNISKHNMEPENPLGKRNHRYLHTAYHQFCGSTSVFS